MSDKPTYRGRLANVWTTNGCFLKGLESWRNRVKNSCRNGVCAGTRSMWINTLVTGRLFVVYIIYKTPHYRKCTPNIIILYYIIPFLFLFLTIKDKMFALYNIIHRYARRFMKTDVTVLLVGKRSIFKICIEQVQYINVV